MCEPGVISKFWKDGYVVIDNFITDEDAEMLKAECRKIVDDMNPREHNTVFLNGAEQCGCDDYFLTSGDKIRFFFEKELFDECDQLKVDKHGSLNKIGHALHCLNPVFKKVTFNENMKRTAKNLNLVDPVVVQSMYIFKNPEIGAKVQPHQDATYLFTEPKVSVYGIWIALEDTTLENGCLWFIPGSHNRELYQRFKRSKPGSLQKTVLLGDDIPDGYDKYVSVPVKKGSAILIHGLVIHKSAKNLSLKPRPIYTFHVAETHETSWSTENWLQPSSEVPFSRIYSDVDEN